MLLSFSLLLTEGGALSNELRIKSASEFIEFSINVNNGMNYGGVTVFLDSDIDFDGKTLTPIGDISRYFLGTFDGQGHTFSNLKIDSTLQYVGLFGCSMGTTIRNVVMDSSCSIVSSYSLTSNAHIGGIIGYCQSSYNNRIVENSVNMGRVIFNGNSHRYLYIGGIIGNLCSSSFDAVVRNCINYGSVYHIGSSKSSYAGGIAGELDGYSKAVHIQNCLNYGTVTNNNTNYNYQYAGGIAGRAYYSFADNCVNAGKVTSNYSSSPIGGIVGHVYYSQISHCYWDKDVSKKGCGSVNSNSFSSDSSFDSSTFILSEGVSIGEYTGASLLDALNAATDNYLLRDYSRWVLNRNEKNITFTINDINSPLTFSSKIVLLPNFASEGHLGFDGWYTDASCESPLAPSEINDNMNLYGKWEENTNNYTITFDTRREGLYTPPINAQFGSVIYLPRNIRRENCVVGFWESDFIDTAQWSFTVPAYNLTLHALWSCTRISNADDLVDLSKIVNFGSNFKGTTVFLDSDIDFNGKSLVPIGKDVSGKNFIGSFNGQGYTIRNLKMNSTAKHSGLFGYSRGVIIKNLVMDSSCSFTSSYKLSTNNYLGGFIGYCYSYANKCAIENCANMANINYNGEMRSGEEYLGGIAGNLYYAIHEMLVKNCANYGSIVHSGTSGLPYIGGIVGFLRGSSSQIIKIQNCLNYGTLSSNNTGYWSQWIGGITGGLDYSIAENCVNLGLFFTNNSGSSVGDISGRVSSSQISYCYWDKDSNDGVLGYIRSGSLSRGSGFDPTTFELNESISLGSYTGKNLLGALNAYTDYYYLNDFSHWALNKNGNTASFTTTGVSSYSFALNSKIILLPSLSSEGKLWFDGWYTDASCKSLLTSFEFIINKELYGKWEENTNQYTITFDTQREGIPNPDPITGQYQSAVSLPRSIERENCTIAWWENELGDTMPWSFVLPAHNLTLHAVWSCTRISSTKDLVDFSSIVNSGTSFSGTTVLLDSDITFTNELSQNFSPIGNFEKTRPFLGIFDGQGYTIKNIKVSSEFMCVGLFGYLEGGIIKNIIIDSFSSVVSKYAFDYVSFEVGGILGWCYSNTGKCSIENCVNMASVSLIGTTFSKASVGGIGGGISSVSYEVTVRNCANYGTIGVYETIRNSISIGGIVGVSGWYKSKSIQNCLNYGAIKVVNLPTDFLEIGGIVGLTQETIITNCLSAGKISIPGNSTGGIVGTIAATTNISYCFWTNEAWGGSLYGSNKSEAVFTVTDSSSVTAPKEALNDLNSRASRSNGWNKWFTLHLNGGRIGNLEEHEELVVVEPFPEPIKEESTFDSWCTDIYCNKMYEYGTTNVSDNTDLYAFWTTIYFISFEPNGGTSSKQLMNVEHNKAYGELPTANKTGYTFLGWFTERTNGEKVTSETIFNSRNNQTFYAHYVINSYILTFVFSSETVHDTVFQFNETIKYPKDIKKKGYFFNGWDRIIGLMPAENITITAQWSEKATEYVNITFEKKGINEEEAKEVINGYTNEEFNIEKFSYDENSGETIATVKFADPAKTTDFIWNINTNRKPEDSFVIKANGFCEESSFIFPLSPSLLLFNFIIM